ncbi:DUF6868 family protein [Pseudomonas guineae]|uniref:DUF6868 family protein n=1 Tax=Pseudomonas guineae TaxID=425504 RepID=UPI003D049929|tara:strand:+ start:668 stop:910 length:243 start_codon:yes stop_codon:yes gene_type:complete
MSLAQLTAFFGWCTVINFAVLCITSLILVLGRGPISAMHSRLMGVAETRLPHLYFQFIAFYKLTFLVFNLAPYIALRIIA